MLREEKTTSENDSIPDMNKMEQEQASLIKIKDSFRKIIIVKDGVSHNNEDGIYIMNLFDFLLNKNDTSETADYGTRTVIIGSGKIVG